ncbi:MAG: DUF1622 domain-containing protein [Eubacteriales bacterium]|nr:DUF1622 domain-containing protein [Eubacteriales bacterium]
MESFIEVLEVILKFVVEISIFCLETAGIIVLVSSAFICFVRWLRRDRENIRLDLAQGIALALEFKMGGEVLRTVIVREWSELGILGAIIVLRAALTFLLHWEIENEKKELKKAGGCGENPCRGGKRRNPERIRRKRKEADPAEDQTADL